MQPTTAPTRRAPRMLFAMLVVVGLALVHPAEADAQCGACERVSGPPVCTVTGGCSWPCEPDPSTQGNLCRPGSGDICDPAEYCDATGRCPFDEYEFAFENTVCRASAGACDTGAETCPGTPGQRCPAQGAPKAAGTQCRAASGTCDVADTCDGTSFACADGFKAAGTECRAASGVCDVAETCSGTSGTCPANGFLSASTECRAANGLCDVAENCTGSSANCPANQFRGAGTVCRASAGNCDVAETCPGGSGVCPLDGFVAGGSTCRASAGACDVAEACSGTSAACPTDGFVAAGTGCRASAGVCDVAEACTGASPTCPNDGFAGTTTVCRGATGACDVAESCSGSGPACPADGFAGSATVCRASAGDCDVAESCTGTGAACPADAFAESTTVCRAAAGDCDVEETCAGDGATCPADGFADTATICRDSLGECDSPESCSGTTADCPADAVSEPDAPCTDDDDVCTLDVCDGAGACVHDPSADTDLDGSCDAADPCTNLGGAQDFSDDAKSKLTLKKIGAQTVPNDDGLTLQGAFDLPAGSLFSDLRLDTTGARLVITDAAGDGRVDVVVPGGLYTGGRTRGWKHSGKTWTYQDKTGTPANGITKLQVADKAKSDTPGRVQVKVTGKNGTYPVVAADVPLEAVITLGSQAEATAGLCGESAYQAADCTVKPSAIGCMR